MKKQWIFLGILILGLLLSAKVKAAAATTDNVAIDATNFPDSTIRKYAILFDADHDGTLSLAERGEAKKLTFGSFAKSGTEEFVRKDTIYTRQGIVSFKGMEYFQNMEYFCIESDWRDMPDSVVGKEILPYLKQVKDIRLYFPSSNGKGESQYWNHHITWNIGEDMSCETLAFSGIQFDSLTITSQKLKKLEIEYCDLSNSYNIDTPNLIRLGMERVRATALNYGVMDKLQILILSMNGLIETDHHFTDSPVTAIDLNKTKNVSQLVLSGCQFRQLNLTPAKGSLKYVYIDQDEEKMIKQLKLGRMQKLAGLNLSGALPSLDVSKCTKLRWLGCNTYGLKKIKLSKSLYGLELVDNGMQFKTTKNGCKSLNLSMCKSLKLLHIMWYRSLKTLDLKANTKLYFLTMDDMELNKLVLPKKKNNKKQWLAYDGEYRRKIRATYRMNETVLEDGNDYGESEEYDYVSGNVLNAQTTIKNVDMTQMKSLKNAKKTMKQEILKSKRRVKKVTISRKLTKPEQEYIKKLAAKQKIKVVVK